MVKSIFGISTSKTKKTKTQSCKNQRQTSISIENPSRGSFGSATNQQILCSMNTAL